MNSPSTASIVGGMAPSNSGISTTGERIHHRMAFKTIIILCGLFVVVSNLLSFGNGSKSNVLVHRLTLLADAKLSGVNVSTPLHRHSPAAAAETISAMALSEKLRSTLQEQEAALAASAARQKQNLQEMKQVKSELASLLAEAAVNKKDKQQEKQDVYEKTLQEMKQLKSEFASLLAEGAENKKDKQQREKLESTATHGSAKDDAVSQVVYKDAPSSVNTNTALLDFLNQFSWEVETNWEIETWQTFLNGLLEFHNQEPLVPIDGTCKPPELPPPSELACDSYPHAHFEDKPRATPAKIGHAIPFGYEVDTLEVHLNEIYDVVDKIFIIEWIASHNPTYFPRKPLIWERVKNQNRFRKFQDKIVHFVLDDLDTQIADGNKGVKSDIWKHEFYQSTKRWEKIVEWNNKTNFFQPNDIIGFGDGDEIASRENIHLVKHCQMKEPKLDVGIWFPINDIETTFCPTYIPIKGEKCSFGDPTFWKWEAAFDKDLYLKHKWQTKNFPDRMWGTSPSYLLGGMHMSEYNYLPMKVAKKITATESTASGMNQVRKEIGDALRANKLDEFEAQLAKPNGNIRGKVKPNSSFDPKDLGPVKYLPWFYDCNRDRFPRWESKPDTRLGKLKPVANSPLQRQDDKSQQEKSSTHIDHFVFAGPKKRTLPGMKLFVPNPWVNHELLEHNTDFMPDDMAIHVFNDTSMTASAKLIDEDLRAHNITGAWEAYSLLRPWAYRADLWRLMILWSEGGVYLDGKMKLHAPLESWAALSENETASLCFDHLDHWNPAVRNGTQTPIFFNAVISAKRGSPILVKAIQIIIDNVRRRFYPSEQDGIPANKSWLSSLAITGPTVLGLAATDPSIPQSSYRKDLKLKKERGILDTGKQQVVISRDMNEHKKVHESGGAFYYDLLKQHSVYCDSERSRDHKDCNIDAILHPSRLR